MKIFIAAALAACAFSSPAMATDLTGVSVTGSLLYPDVSTTYSGPVTTVVGPSVEFAAGAFPGTGGTIDVAATTITYFTNASVQYGSGSFNGYRLDFGNRVITGLTLNAASTFTPVDYYFSGSSVFFSVANQQVQSSDKAIFDVTSAVPEPATWMLMLMGFGLVGVGMRRRKPIKTIVTFA